MLTCDHDQGSIVGEWVRAWTTPFCQCLSGETLKAVSPFYLVSTPGELMDPISLYGNV